MAILSILENSTVRGAWQATVHGVAKSQTQLSAHVHVHTHTHTHIRNTKNKTQTLLLGTSQS